MSVEYDRRSVLATPTMTAPARAHIGSRITVRAARLESGRYTLLLAVELPTGGASPTTCSARVGAARTRDGHVTITGRLPRRLTCRMGEGSVAGYDTVRPGRYVLSLGILIPPAGFQPAGFVKRTVRLVR